MRKKILISFFFLLLILGVLFFLTARYADRIVDPYVRSLLEQNKPMKHRIDYRKIRVNLITQVINIKDVRMYPDTNLVKDENIWMQVSVGVVKLTHFRIREMLFQKSLQIGDLILLQPEVELHLPVGVNQDVVEEVAKDTVQPNKSQLLTRIFLKRMLISGGSFRLIRNDATLASTNEINFVARDINLVRNSKDEPVGYTYGDVNIALSNIKLRSETGMYDMSLGKFSVNKQDSSVHLENFVMKPKYDKKEFTKKLEYQTERYDISIRNIDFERIGYRRILNGEPLEIARIFIDGIYADIYKDKNIPFDPNKFPLFFNESLLKLPLPIDLDTVAVTNSTLLYNELANGRTEPGLIRLDNFALQIYDLSTHPEDDSLENKMQADVQANIMGEGPMNVSVIFPLEGNLRHVECSGSVGAMHLAPLNAMLEPSMNIKFNGGTVTRMTFSFSGDENTSNGWMEFLYKDLDVVILKKEEKSESGLLSFLANTVANSNNPAPGKTQIKSVEIGTDRDKNRGPVNFIWKTIQSGMVRTILPINKYAIKQKPEPQKKSKSSSQKKK